MYRTMADFRSGLGRGHADPRRHHREIRVLPGLISAAGSTIARKIDHAILAFEADELDNATCQGWSVTETGRAEVVTDPAVAARYQSVPLAPWAPGARDQLVTISIDRVEGLRVRQETMTRG